MKNRRRSRVLVLERSRYGYGTASQSKIAFIEKHIGKIAELSRLYVSNLLLLAVQALSDVAQVHDRETSGHAQRMVRLAEATARALGRSDEDPHHIRLAPL